MSVVYAIRTDRHGAQTLCEVEKDEAPTFFEGENECSGAEYTRVSAQYARQWVKDGGHHSTALYVDRKRVRRAGQWWNE